MILRELCSRWRWGMPLSFENMTTANISKKSYVILYKYILKTEQVRQWLKLQFDCTSTTVSTYNMLPESKKKANSEFEWQCDVFSISTQIISPEVKPGRDFSLNKMTCETKGDKPFQRVWKIHTRNVLMKDTAGTFSAKSFQDIQPQRSFMLPLKYMYQN